ncbi:hypothetical protein [Nocardiopsis lambiniae]|uniref:hypothetical protein n=1 Tax=Nocardiopsis lambiniae TaxID=3075539 RepID=UPI00288AC5A0|nr:hypothetical protein [Nocardiopsis sp. DSM 44743]
MTPFGGLHCTRLLQVATRRTTLPSGACPSTSRATQGTAGVGTASPVKAPSALVIALSGAVTALTAPVAVADVR